jgi:hypothetical protein
MNQVTAALLTLKPRHVKAVELLHRLTDNVSPPDASALLLLEPEIEAAMHDGDDLGARSGKVVTKCLSLSAVPLKTTPPGF